MDVLVKNCQFRVHNSIGRRKIMKTLSRVARRRVTSDSIVISDLALDIVQGWAQAFKPRRALFPFMVSTYVSLKHKHCIKFIRPDHDDTRVPIFLGPISYADRQILQQQIESDRSFHSYLLTYHSSEKSNYSIPSVHEDQEDEEEDEGKLDVEEEDLIQFDQITLGPASSNTPIQNYGYIVPSPLFQPLVQYGSNIDSTKTVINPHRGIVREYSDDENRSSMPTLKNSVESMMESLRNVQKPPLKPPRMRTEDNNPSTYLNPNPSPYLNPKPNPKEVPQKDSFSSLQLQHDNSNITMMEEEASSNLSTSIRNYDKRKKQLKEKKNVVAADHDVDIKFFGNQRYVKREKRPSEST